MMQGDAYRLPIQISVGGYLGNAQTFEDVEVFIGSIRKTLSKGEITYNNEREVFLVDLSQQDTFRLRGKAKVTIRCKFLNGEVIGTNAGEIVIDGTVSKVVL